MVSKTRKIVREVFLTKAVLIVKADIVDKDIDVKEETLQQLDSKDNSD